MIYFVNVSIPAMGGNRRNKEDANRQWIINPRDGGNSVAALATSAVKNINPRDGGNRPRLC